MPRGRCAGSADGDKGTRNKRIVLYAISHDLLNDDVHAMFMMDT